MKGVDTVRYHKTMVRSERAGGRRTVEMVASAACLNGNGDRIPHPLHGDVDGLPSAEPCPRIARIEHVHLMGPCATVAQTHSFQARGAEGTTRACRVGAGRAGARAQKETCKCPARAVSRHSDSRTSEGTCIERHIDGATASMG